MLPCLVRLALNPMLRQLVRLQSLQSRRRWPSRRLLPAVLRLGRALRLQRPPIPLLLHLPLGRLPTRPPPRQLAPRLAQQQRHASSQLPPSHAAAAAAAVGAKAAWAPAQAAAPLCQLSALLGWALRQGLGWRQPAAVGEEALPMC